MIRAGDVPDDLLVVLRAVPAQRADAIDALIESAAESAGIYLVLGSDGAEELLFGVSVFALRPGTDPIEVLRRFPFAPRFVTASAGELRAAGFPIHPTGSNPDHFDVQLLPGRLDGSMTDMGQLRLAAGRLLDVASESQPNPAYAVSTDAGSEEER
jgi:hypothetical protein